MSKYQSITIKEAMNNIASNQYLLPAIQRKFVWEIGQIEMLFDSILRNYPINSFMFWKITDEKIKKNSKFYVFIKDFAKKYHEDNPDAPTELIDNFYAVIDGQQRLNSLYIGLIGTYRTKKPSKRRNDNEDAMPTRVLYLELSEPLNTDIDNEKIYNFRFLTKDEKENDLKEHPEHFWFKVGDILDFKNLADVNEYIIKNELISQKFAILSLSDLFNKLNNEELINYYLIDEQDANKILDVFIRTNSGGSKLTFSDLLMSIASANWSKFDARDEIRKVKAEIFKFGNPNFDVSQDFILKTTLVLSDVDVRFKTENFGRENIAIFEDKWEDIKKSILATFQLLEQIGFNDSLLKSKNAVIPIAYYIYKNHLASNIVKSTYDKQDKENISRWLSMSLLKGLFGGHSDNILKTIRDVIKSSTIGKFPMQEIFDKFKSDANKNYVFNDDVIDSFLEEQYGTEIAGLVLNLLYPDVVLEHGRAIAEDHIHPKSMFEGKGKLTSLNLTPEQEKFFTDKKNYNSVLNLQLLEESKNKSKSDKSLVDWSKGKKREDLNLYVDNETSLELKDFEEFIETRRIKLKEKLKSILSV